MTELEYNSSCWGLPVNSHQVNLLQIGQLSYHLSGSLDSKY